MKNEITSIVKKSAKVGAAVFVAAGAIALVTSGAALKALAEGAGYLKNTVTKILRESPENGNPVDEAGANAVPAEAAAAEDEAEAAPADAEEV